jgi:ubiquinol-cytochrome c reductase cytochrome b/c1 subunit
VLFMLLFGLFVFYFPNALGHPDNYTPANPLVTPAHIVPEWYYLPFYAILRAFPNKLMGVIAMFGSIGILFVLPWLDTSKVRSMRFRPTARWFFIFFLVDCLILGFCGSNPPDQPVLPGGLGFQLADYNINSFVWLSRVAVVYYFLYFILITPVLGIVEKPLPVPDTISSPVLPGPDLHTEGKA